MYKVIVRRKVLRRIQRLPESVQRRVANLVEDLRDKGPIRSDWPHYSKLGADQYHCHLSRDWVACWSYAKTSKTIEVYYAGSRENAPY